MEKIKKKKIICRKKKKKEDPQEPRKRGQDVIGLADGRMRGRRDSGPGTAKSVGSGRLVEFLLCRADPQKVRSMRSGTIAGSPSNRAGFIWWRRRNVENNTAPLISGRKYY